MKAIRVAVASQNPVKVGAAKAAFDLVFEGYHVDVIGSHADSGVSAQPMSEEETKIGAHNRVNQLIKLIDADYYVAYEGGVDVFEDGPKTFAIICVATATAQWYGQTAMLPLPISVYHMLLNGEELGDAMDSLFRTQNIKHRGGAIGQLTKGHQTRQSIYTSATILAMAPIISPNLYE